MQKYQAFLRWALFMSITLVAFYIAAINNFFTHLYEKDLSGIGFFLLVLLILTSFWCGFKTWNLTKTATINGEERLGVNSRAKIKETKLSSNIVTFIAALCPAIGFLGTLIGIAMALDISFDAETIANHQKMQNTMGQIVEGMGTAIYTTLVGIIAGIILQIQSFNLRYSLDKLA